MHSAPEPRCTHDDSKSFGFLYPPQHNLSECYHQTQYKRTRRCKKRNKYSITMHTASEPSCTHDDSKSFGFLYPPQHNHSGCYHQTQYKRTRRCKKRNEFSITMHSASEPRCTHDDSKSFGFLYPPQHNHSGCYHQTQYKRTRRCKKRNESSKITFNRNVLSVKATLYSLKIEPFRIFNHHAYSVRATLYPR